MCCVLLNTGIRVEQGCWYPCWPLCNTMVKYYLAVILCAIPLELTISDVGEEDEDGAGRTCRASESVERTPVRRESCRRECGWLAAGPVQFLLGCLAICPAPSSCMSLFPSRKGTEAVSFPAPVLFSAEPCWVERLTACLGRTRRRKKLVSENCQRAGGLIVGLQRMAQRLAVRLRPALLPTNANLPKVYSAQACPCACKALTVSLFAYLVCVLWT